MTDFVEKNTIFRCIAGSQAYGMSTPQSDTDTRGVCIAPMDHYLGFVHSFEQQEDKTTDTVIYDIRKFFKLATECSPSILEFLWMPEDCVVITSKWWEKIVEHRQKFLSIRAKDTFVGYATAQLKKIRTHRGWLLEKKPKKHPDRSDFGLPDNAAALVELRKKMAMMTEAGLDPMGVYGKEIEAESKYKKAMKEWEAWKNWKETRNEKRAALEEKFGYDCKHAAHLVRLLRVGFEVVLNGNVQVRRPDAEELFAIRNGAWTYEQVEDYAEKMQEQIEALVTSGGSILPNAPDREFLNERCASIIEIFHWDMDHGIYVFENNVWKLTGRLF